MTVQHYDKYVFKTELIHFYVLLQFSIYLITYIQQAKYPFVGISNKSKKNGTEIMHKTKQK